MTFELPQSFREARWAAFERALAEWLETPEGGFSVYWAEHERRDTPRATEELVEGLAEP